MWWCVMRQTDGGYYTPWPGDYSEILYGPGGVGELRTIWSLPFLARAGTGAPFECGRSHCLGLRGVDTASPNRAWRLPLCGGVFIL